MSGDLETRIYELQQDENDRDVWHLVAAVHHEVGHIPRPITALSSWFDETDPVPGSYRAEGPRGAATLSWHGAEAPA